jgi:hypothetical protein
MVYHHSAPQAPICFTQFSLAHTLHRLASQVVPTLPLHGLWDLSKVPKVLVVRPNGSLVDDFSRTPFGTLRLDPNHDNALATDHIRIRAVATLLSRGLLGRSNLVGETATRLPGVGWEAGWSRVS